MGLSALSGQSSTWPSLVSSCLVLSPRRLPCLAPFGSVKGPPGLSWGARSRQKSSRKAPEAARRAQRNPQGGHREVIKRLRRPTGGPQGAPRGRWEAENNYFYVVVWFRGFENRCEIRPFGASTPPKPRFGCVFRPRTSAKPSLLGPFVLRTLQNTRDLGPQAVSK